MTTPTIEVTREDTRQGMPRLRSQKTTITTAQVLALFATPITVVPAPAAGLVNIVIGAKVFLDHAGTDYAGIAAGEDLVLNYTDAAGATIMTIESTGFLDASADALRYQAAPATILVPVAAAVIVAHILLGEIITGDSPLEVEVLYVTIEANNP